MEDCVNACMSKMTYFSQRGINVSAPNKGGFICVIIISVGKLLLFLHNRQWKTFALWQDLQ